MTEVTEHVCAGASKPKKPGRKSSNHPPVRQTPRRSYIPSLCTNRRTKVLLKTEKGPRRQTEMLGKRRKGWMNANKYCGISVLLHVHK